MLLKMLFRNTIQNVLWLRCMEKATSIFLIDSISKWIAEMLKWNPKDKENWLNDIFADFPLKIIVALQRNQSIVQYNETQKAGTSKIGNQFLHDTAFMRNRKLF